ncbi:esterase-like activity of phytase family protein [Rhizobium sp. NRK18]|uniref:esterase-like activity of phytase family protein n=1 Tax=Rhizobium sp. NRK18 TaxID=2964667 RepID=UPI0021C34D41|nr:esterase-like activity of phytase family protein [Rhizobium sp. NRK18]MCQ2003054.1 esterase-like activity of phytase family protein [Rhizobium sp. NRK18]
MRFPNRRAVIACAAFAVTIGLSGPANGGSTVTARQITTFEPGSDATRFGAFEFVGGLVMSSPDSLFGAWSSIRFRPDGRHFVGVLDTGHWITGQIERGKDGRLSGLGDVAITAVKDASGSPQSQKWRVDAEGLTMMDGGEIAVSFEQRHRVDVYPDPGFEASKPLRTLDFLIPRDELRSNGGFETLVHTPDSGPLGGSLMVIAEKSVDAAGNMFGAVLSGPRKGVFTVRRTDDFDVTDGTFLPDGDLLILERRFNFSDGLDMRIRRISADDIRPGALVDGDVLLQAGLSYQIDNMEGIDAVQAEDGSTHVILVSDDNHSILQRSLMLEFKLVE